MFVSTQPGTLNNPGVVAEKEAACETEGRLENIQVRWVMIFMHGPVAICIIILFRLSLSLFNDELYRETSETA